MTDYIEKRVADLKRIFIKNQKKICITFLNAMDGMGKETTLMSFFDEIGYSDTIEITSHGNMFPLKPFIASLLDEMDNILLESNKSEIQRAIKEKIFAMLEITNRLIIVIKNLSKFDDETAFFIIDLAKLLINIDTKKTILFLICQDEIVTYKLRNKIKSLNKFTYYINFPKWTSQDLRDLLKEVYPNNILDNDSINKIIDCSFNNAGVFLNNIEFLKERGFIYVENNSLICQFLPDNILFGNYKEVIQSRYNMLDIEMKDALKKASIIGFNFNVITIENAFKLNMVAQLMIEIEHITRLISQTDMYVQEYEFVNSKAHKIIENYIPHEKKKQWITVLASYYENLSYSATDLASYLSYCEYAMSAAYYYEKNKMYNKIISIYYKVIPILMNRNFYYKSLELIDKLKKLDITQYSMPKRLICQVHYWEYQCNFMLFNMRRGLKAFRNYRRNLNLSSIETIHADYKESLMLYDANYTKQAYNIILECYNKVQDINETDIYLVRLKIQIISLLCSIEETLLIKSCKAHFNEAADLARHNRIYDLYYSLLRISGIAYSGKICVTLLHSAANYFADKNDVEYAMTLHNLASEQLFCGDSADSLKNFKKAYDIFLKLTHNGIICVRNGLSIYIAIYNQQYNKALEYIYNFATDYNEDFLKLVLCYNITTILRKKGNFIVAKKYLNKTISLNAKKENKFPYFSRFIYAQKGYFALENNQFEQAWELFKKFFYHEYKDRIEYSLSIAITMAELSKKLNRKLPPDIALASKTKHKLAKHLAKEKLIFCEVLFWE